MRNQPETRSEDFVRICATSLGFMEILEISELAGSVTYALSMRPIVGAPSFAFLLAKGGIARTQIGRPCIRARVYSCRKRRKNERRVPPVPRTRGPGIARARPHHPCHPERSPAICCCFSPPSTPQKTGCPILRLFVGEGWDSTNPNRQALYQGMSSLMSQPTTKTVRASAPVGALPCHRALKQPA